MLARITGRSFREEARTTTTSYDLLGRIRATRLRWLGHILREGEGRLIYHAVKEQRAAGKFGDLLMDAPPHSSLYHLQLIAKDKDEWRRLVNAIHPSTSNSEPPSTTTPENAVQNHHPTQTNTTTTTSTTAEGHTTTKTTTTTTKTTAERTPTTSVVETTTTSTPSSTTTTVTTTISDQTGLTTTSTQSTTTTHTPTNEDAPLTHDGPSAAASAVYVPVPSSTTRTTPTPPPTTSTNNPTTLTTINEQSTPPRPAAKKKRKRKNKREKPAGWSDAQRQAWAREYYLQRFAGKTTPTTSPTLTTTTTPLNTSQYINWDDMVNSVNEKYGPRQANASNHTTPPYDPSRDSEGVLWAAAAIPPSDDSDQDSDLWTEPAPVPTDSDDSRDSNGVLWAAAAVPPSDDSDHGSDLWAEPADPPSDSDEDHWAPVTPNRNCRRLTPAPPSRNATTIDDHTNNINIMIENTHLAPPNLHILEQWSPMILGHHHILRHYSPTHNPNLHPTRQLSILLSPPKYNMFDPPLTNLSPITLNANTYLYDPP